ncbi:hypothetical protein NDU88_010401 [Pleurodeles waltl]|uniref:Uncharacterized protein n=1 Tax=Pleurodeles waltl TaxID=8319 RepID=A0AAV7PXS8_PLEWA|nr:hypothetical protein NDU88_010401 [Pleurodeles waltl]
MIRGMIMEAESAGWITRQEAEFLDTKNPRTPYFYCLPKIHKSTPPPGRPIVSGIGSLLEPLSKFCDFFLQPMVRNTSTFLRDTKDTLILLNDVNDAGPTDILICLDVEALITNIPQEATLAAVEDLLLAETWTYNTPVSFIMQCASVALKENFFQFETRLFHQIQAPAITRDFALIRTRAARIPDSMRPVLHDPYVLYFLVMRVSLDPKSSPAHLPLRAALKRATCTNVNPSCDQLP